MSEKLSFLSNAVDMDAPSIDFGHSHKSIMPTKMAIGVVTGMLTLVGVAAAVVAAMVVYRKRGKKNYEKLPLLADEYVFDFGVAYIAALLLVAVVVVAVVCLLLYYLLQHC